MTAYGELEARFGRLGAVEEAIAVLHWDAAAMMPAGGAAARAEQLADAARHRAPAAERAGDPRSARRRRGRGDVARRSGSSANLREMRRRWQHAAALPDDLVAALSRARSASETAWRQARPADDFAAALPGLEAVLGLTREIAAAKAAALGTSPYEALLDQYEPGMHGGADRPPVRPDRAASCRSCSMRVLSRQAARPAPPQPRGPFPIADQRRAATLLMQRIGFDFAHGRLDESAPSVLRRHARRRAADHALRRGRFRQGADGDAARDRACALPARLAGGMAAPAGRPRARHGVARKPVAAAGNAGVPQPRRSPGSRRRCCARSSAATTQSGRPRHLHRRQIAVAAGPDPRRCRRGDLSRACHPALPAGARDDRRRSRARATCPAPSTTASTR